MVFQKTTKTISLFEKEARIFELINERGPSSSLEIATLENNSDILSVMRTVHKLEERGVLIRTIVDGKKLFMVKPKLKSIKIVTRPRIGPINLQA